MRARGSPDWPPVCDFLPFSRRSADLRAWAVAGCLVAGALPVRAQEWQVLPTLNVRAGYDDNVTLSADDPQRDLASNIRAGIRAQRATGNTSLGLLGGLSLNEFLDSSALSNVAAFAGADAVYSTPRSEYRLNLSLSTQSTLTSETATTGVTDTEGQQYQLSIRPGWTYRLSERSTLGISASYRHVFYEGVEDGSLSDYWSGDLSLLGRRRLTEVTGISVVASYGRYQSQDDTNESENLALQLGADYQLSETLSFDGLFGLRRTQVTALDSLGRTVTEDSTGPAFSVGLEKRLARGGGLRVRILRELTPSGAAEVLDTTSLQLGYDHPLNERLSLRLSSRAYRNRQPGGDTSASDRTYADAQVGLSYQISPALSLVLAYRHRWQQLEEEPTDARSNELSLSLAWRGR